MAKIINKTFLLGIIFLLGILSTKAQSVDELSDEQIQQFMKQAQESGMTEEQLIAAAAARGFTPNDIIKFRERMTRLQSDKKNTSLKGSSIFTRKFSTSSDTTNILDSIDINESKIKYKPVDSLELRRLQIFGLSFFNNKKLTFEPNLRIPTPKNYIIGADDELNIDITGYAYQHYNVKVSPEGTIRIENLSPIYVNGLTIEQAKERIVNRLKAIFAGLNGGGLSADLTLGNIRSIKVTVIGEAVQPGTYTISSLATVFNVLYACGGPSDIGSLRNIEVFRGGKVVRVLDFYDFLLKGDQKDNIILQDQDIIHIPYVDVRVSLKGEIRNPKTFELKKGETLKDIITYSGGFRDYAYTKSLSVERVTPIEKKIITINQNEIPAFIPEKGDVYTIGKILNRFENVVTVKGAVYREGSYELEKNMTVKQLIERAEGLKDDAFKNRILLKRERENLEPEILALDLNQILKGEMEDIRLKLKDTLFIKSYKDLRERLTIQIDGSVNKTGTYEYADNMTVSDVVAIAGGFSDGASPSKIEIARRIKDDTIGLSKEQSIRIILLDIDRNLQLSPDDKKFLIKPFDRIYVRRLPRYEEQKNVSITGEVFYPGPYALRDKKERISDLIQKSGGIKSEADLGGARFTRAGRVIGVDLIKILDARDDINNLVLNSGDALEIPRRKETVTISGQVYNPLTVPYSSNLKLKDYLDLAGGTNDSAYVKKTYVKYGNGRLDRTRSFFGVKIYPKIENGSEIFVPTRKKYKWTPAERIAVSSALVSIATILVTIIRL